MLKLIYTGQDAAVAERLGAQLRAAGYEVSDGMVGRGDVALVLLSPASAADSAVQAAINQALDASVHLVPVEVKPVEPPPLIAHLGAVDVNDFDSIRAWVDTELSPEAGLAMRALTPKARRANRTSGLVLGAVALAVFIVGLIAVGVFHLQAPVEEYNNIDTMAAATRDILAAPQLKIYSQFLPQSTEQAANYLPTLMAVPTAYRPLMAMTATAIAATPAPRSYYGG